MITNWIPIAQNFLCQYAPDMLKYAMPLPVPEVFQRMGLNAGVADLPKNTLGQLCFAPRTVGIYTIEAQDFVEQEVPRGTILVRAEKDGPNYLERSIFPSFTKRPLGKTSKVHRLCLLMEQDTTDIRMCPTTLTDSQRLSSDNLRMEWQANNLAARILVPTITAEKKFKQLLNEIKRKQPTWRDAVVMEEAIKRLAELYRVSNEISKIPCATTRIRTGSRRT